MAIKSTAAKLRVEATPEPFTGFTPALFAFLEGLAANQTREWFQEHKGEYETHVRKPLCAFVDAVSFAFQVHDIPLMADGSKAVFRIHRDVRFSKDKRPYKTNAAATLTRDGTRGSKGMAYVNLGGHGEAVERTLMLGLGMYGIEPEDLLRIRTAIVERPDRWASVETALAEAGLGFSDGEPLSRMPKGFEAHADAPAAERLRMRHFITAVTLREPVIYDADLVARTVAFVEPAMPLLHFLWDATRV